MCAPNHLKKDRSYTKHLGLATVLKLHIWIYSPPTTPKAFQKHYKGFLIGDRGRGTHNTQQSKKQHTHMHYDNKN